MIISHVYIAEILPRIGLPEGWVGYYGPPLRFLENAHAPQRKKSKIK